MRARAGWLLPFGLMLFASTAARAQAVPPSQMVRNEDFRKLAAKLAAEAKASPNGIAFTVILTRPDGGEQYAVRVKSGQGEWHRDFVDYLIGVDGEAEVVTGGEIVNGKETAPGEIRGDGVRGGTRQHFGPGDVIRIEAGVPHQFLVKPGMLLGYKAVKVKAVR